MDSSHAIVGCLGILALVLVAIAVSVAIGMRFGNWVGWLVIAAFALFFGIWFIAASLGK